MQPSYLTNMKANKENKKKHVKHHKTHVHHKPKREPSRFSLFSHKIANVFKDIIEAPPEPPKEEVEEVSEVESVSEVLKVEEEELQTPEIEKEPEHDLKHAEVMQNLNKAVASWKETGDIGIHLEAPVPLREKVKLFWSKVKNKSSPVSAKLKSRIDEVIAKAATRVKKAEVSGEKVNTEKVVKQEWGKVFDKMEAVSKPSERKEIEKIYKELMGK